MPVYKGSKPGTRRVVVWHRNRRWERVVRGDMALAEQVEAAMREQLADGEPCTIRVAKIGNGASRIIREPIKSGRVVYFVRLGQRGPIKIGKTNDIDARLEALQCGSPETLLLLGTLPGYSVLERLLHQAFGEVRLNGEWFEASGDLLTFLHEMFLTPEEQADIEREDREEAEAADVNLAERSA